jgi:FtsH-binding integral membrane protein
MKRFLIFICLFPGMALAGLFVFVSIGVGALPDNPEVVKLVAWGYAVGGVPAFILALVDSLLGRTRIPRVFGTVLVGYGIAVVVAFTVFDWELIGRILAFGLIGAIPAAICSWLSRKEGEAATQADSNRQLAPR